MRKLNFAPVVDGSTRILILGSFPGEESLRQQQYYAHPQNSFWDIIGSVLGEDLRSLIYEDRLPRLLAHGVGLWDVVASCVRTGSLDSAIRDHEHEDFSILKREAPNLTHIFFNGKRAGACRKDLEAMGYATVHVPSTSPAYAVMSREGKRDAWSAAILPVLRNG